MNDDKRERIQEHITGLEGIRDEEQQDLIDTPDNIEFSKACDDFRTNIGLLEEAVDLLKAAITKD